MLTAEEQALMDTEIVGKTGQKRKIEVRIRCFLYRRGRTNFAQMIMGRQKLKKSLQYEIKWKGLDHKWNTWMPREELIERGFVKLVRQFDDLEASREGECVQTITCYASLMSLQVPLRVTLGPTLFASISTKLVSTATSLSTTSLVA